MVGFSKIGDWTPCEVLRSTGVLNKSDCSCNCCVSCSETGAALTSLAGAFCLLRLRFRFLFRLRPFPSEFPSESFFGASSLDPLDSFPSSFGLRLRFLLRFLLRLRFLLLPSRPSPLFSPFGAFSLLSLISSCLRNHTINEPRFLYPLLLGSQHACPNEQDPQYLGGCMDNP